jgi:hypothetical protein
MLHLLFSILFATTPLLPEPTFGAIHSTVYASPSDTEADVEPPGRWDNAGKQFLAGTAGASIGTLGGGFVGGLTGYLIGEATSSKKDRCEEEQDDDGGWCIPASFGTAIIGSMIGAGVMGVWTSAQFVSLAAPKSHPSSGVGIGMLGSMVGAMGGFAIMGATSNSVDWEFWPGFAVVMASSSAGALVLDRQFAVPRRLSVSPWVPRPGLNGAMLSMEL